MASLHNSSAKMAAAATDRSDVASGAADRRLTAAVETHRSILSGRIEADPYLSSVAARHRSHRFLGRCTQAVLRRQVAFLERVLTAATGLRSEELRVLDWGCGKGHISYLLRRRGFDVTTCDANDGSDDCAFGQETPIITEQGIEVVPLDDAVRLPFPDASFDCVTSFGVLEHVPHDRPSMREIRRVLRPGGVFFVAFLPYALSWTQAVARLRGNVYHDRLYRRAAVLAMAAEAGFRVEAMWLAQLFPKNSVPLALDPILEPLDRLLCRHTPLRLLATNLEAILVATDAKSPA